MGNFSIWHILFLVLIAGAASLEFIKRRKGSWWAPSSTEDEEEQRRRREREAYSVNPTTGMPMISETRDAGGNAIGSDPNH